MHCRMPLLLAAVLQLLGCSAACAWQLVTEENPPYNMRQDGRVVGISTDKLLEAFQRVGVKPDIQIMPWARAYQSALTRSNHCVFSTARNTDREPLFKWIGPIAEAEWVLYKTADAAVPARLDDVRGQVIGGYLEDVITKWLLAQGYHVEAATSDAVNPRKLIAGRIDFWASTPARASRFLAAGNLASAIVPALSFGRSQLYLACHPSASDAMVRRLNDALRDMGKDGTSARIEARYANRLKP
ncbi:substrate-binding periplasmic protein [Noviherbaspirillum sp. Root189]|uniref:substrate-binding periplasmic protein n=1 Tax=Noviherbaspirillum sp. Root189 TaxID=1736487 RepID=UPI00138F850A|nr:transporter substrate-binding domain-containing protein [Noviherbaspirillum sp. Root189]